MITFLFWNLNRKPLQDIVSSLATAYKVDVLMLTECSIEPNTMLAALNQRDEAEYHYAPCYGCSKVEIFTRFTAEFIRPIYELDRLTVRCLNLPGLTDILLAVSHLPSKLYWSDESQAFECVELSNSIRNAEQQIGHSRTVLVGDFNMNPFEGGIVSAIGLHAVMTRHIAQKKSRVVQEKEYPFFYNPMWNFFGDSRGGPPGTYYYTNAEPKVFFWNIFDQVLVRPDLLSRFSTEDLSIIHHHGDTSLLTKQQVPNTDISSDHLPILFKIQL